MLYPLNVLKQTVYPPFQTNYRPWHDAQAITHLHIVTHAAWGDIANAKF